MSNELITVVAPTVRRINEHARAIERTAALIPYRCKLLLISPIAPTVPFSGEVRNLPLWFRGYQWSFQEWNQFMIYGLVKEITTPYCITVHWDGFAINENNWTDKFLEYDYIGAPWPKWLAKKFPIEFNPHAESSAGRVGNGGFSLRSKRWLDSSAKLVSQINPRKEIEDIFMCRKFLWELIRNGCRIAPLDLALKFSVDGQIEEYPNHTLNDSFGFHGFWQKEARAYRMSQPSFREKVRDFIRNYKWAVSSKLELAHLWRFAFGL